MSRLKNYASALGSSYLALAANIAYTLLSVPLALRHLSNPEFALWGLTFQMAGYIALIDFGMAGVSRILIDYKDCKDDPTYGSVIQTTVAVSIVQGLLVLLCGVAVAFGLKAIIRVPEAFHREFMLLIVGQCAVMAGQFATRIFGFLLSAHQRQDAVNYVQALVFAVSFGALWASLRSGCGVFSILWAQVSGWALTTVFAIIWCFRLNLFPHPGCWGKPTWARFSELFAYGRDIFLFALGNQLINASQVILVTRQLGLEAAAIWVICTRSYLVVVQLIYRIFDNSCPALAEMIVRQEKGWLLHRFRSIVLISASGSVVAALVFAVCNQPFVNLWTSGKASWPAVNDALLATGLVLSATARCHVGLSGQTKQFRFLRYIFLLEGLWVVGWSVIVLQSGGISAMLLVTMAGTLLFSFTWGTWQTANYFGLRWSEVALNWSRPTLTLALLLAPIGLITSWALRSLPSTAELVFGGIVTSLIGPALFVRYGLDATLRAELLKRLPTSLRARFRLGF